MRHFVWDRLRAWSPRRWEYSHHRAIVVSGALIVAIAVGSGLLGVLNAGRAETSASTLSDRYLVLLSPARQVRASIADFQLVVQAGVSGAVPNQTELARAVGDDTTTDHQYDTLDRLLDATGDTTLARSLAATMAAYQASRSGLAGFLAAGSRTPENLALAAKEETADSQVDAALADLQDTITNDLAQSAAQAQTAARTARDDLLWCLGIGSPFGIILIAVFARKSLRVERDDARRDAGQAQISRRADFESRLQRALEMAKSEPPAFDIVAQALGEAAPGMYSELLLADSSRAHFRQVLVTQGDDDHPGCGVVSPSDCPAASRGQTMIFAVSTAMDTCPNLRGRGRSALCVPVSIGGSSVGVTHVTTTDGSPPPEAVRRDVEMIARRASERFAMLRAFEASQTEASTDSLTGLMTRRNLESRIGELYGSGLIYSVAYGDLDHFKQLNDAYGHSAGDRALRAFSQVLRDALRPSDLACRFGGEEFVVVLPNCHVSEAIPVLERVRERLAERLTSGHLPTFTVSFGIASSDHGNDFETVVAAADDALLRAKGAGRDRVLVASDPSPGATSVAVSDTPAPAAAPPSDVVTAGVLPSKRPVPAKVA